MADGNDDNDLPGLQPKDWKGVLACIMVAGFFALLGLSIYLDEEVPLLEAIFGIIMTIAISYFSKENGQ